MLAEKETLVVSRGIGNLFPSKHAANGACQDEFYFFGIILYVFLLFELVHYSVLRYRIKLDRWPRHVTPSEKRPFFYAVTLFATYILGHKVDAIRNVTVSHLGF